MNEFKGTPGPWERDYNNSDTGEGQWQIAGPAEIHYPYNCYRGEEEKAIADANLIAAAPELLEVLQSAIYHVREQAKSDAHAYGVLKACNDVINKALGQ